MLLLAHTVACHDIMGIWGQGEYIVRHRKGSLLQDVRLLSLDIPHSSCCARLENALSQNARAQPRTRSVSALYAVNVSLRNARSQAQSSNFRQPLTKTLQTGLP